MVPAPMCMICCLAWCPIERSAPARVAKGAILMAQQEFQGPVGGRVDAAQCALRTVKCGMRTMGPFSGDRGL